MLGTTKLYRLDVYAPSMCAHSSVNMHHADIKMLESKPVCVINTTQNEIVFIYKKIWKLNKKRKGEKNKCPCVACDYTIDGALLRCRVWVDCITIVLGKHKYLT